MVITFYVTVNRWNLLTFLSLMLSCISPPSSPLSQYSVCTCVCTCVCTVSLVSQGTPWWGAKVQALISIWICSPRQESFSSCQHSTAHRFQFLKWSIILFYLFAALLPAATAETDTVVVFCLWLLCYLHSVLSDSTLVGLSNLFTAGMLVFVTVSSRFIKCFWSKWEVFLFLLETETH